MRKLIVVAGVILTACASAPAPTGPLPDKGEPINAALLSRCSDVWRRHGDQEVRRCPAGVYVAVDRTTNMVIDYGQPVDARLWHYAMTCIESGYAVGSDGYDACFGRYEEVEQAAAQARAAGQPSGFVRFLNTASSIATIGAAANIATSDLNR